MWFWLVVLAVMVVVAVLMPRLFRRLRHPGVDDERLAVQASAEAERRKYPLP